MSTSDGARALALSWRSRADGEARVSLTFSRLADALPAGEVQAFVLEGLRAAAREELGHAEICQQMAAHYGEPLREPLRASSDEPLPLATPLHRALMLVTACCISETISVAYLEHCLRLATHTPTRDGLKSLLRDEVGHAQLGWAFLGSLPKAAPLRSAIEPSLAGLIEKTEAIWHARVVELHPAPEAARGYPAAESCSKIVTEAVEQLVRPGFAALDLRV